MHPLQRPPAVAVALALAFVLVAPVPAAQPPRVAPDAQTVRAFRLAESHLVGLRRVAGTLARGHVPSPERPRADAAVFVVLSMSLAYNEPFRDRTVSDMVRTIETGHADLHAAIRDAGLTSADYVLTQITLLLAYPAVAGGQAARPMAAATDVAAENIAFVRRHGAEVEAILSELAAAAGRPQTAAPPGGLEGVERFHEGALGPALAALAKRDTQEARRLAAVVLSAFEALAPQLRIGQVGDVQRVSRRYLDRGLAAEADMLLTRAAAAWEPVMQGPQSPLGPFYADLARARRLSGKVADAERLIQRAQTMRGTAPTRTDPDAFPIYVELAELRRLRGDVDGAAQLLLVMVGFADGMRGWEYVPNLIPVFESYAEVLEQRGQAVEARQLRARADRIRRNYAP